MKYSIPNDKYVLTKIKDRMGQEIEEKINDGLNLDRISQITEYWIASDLRRWSIYNFI